MISRDVKYPAGITNQQQCKISGKKLWSWFSITPTKSPVTISHPTSKEWIRWSLWWVCQWWQSEERSLLCAQQYITAHAVSKFLGVKVYWFSTFPFKSSKYFTVKVKLGGNWIWSLLLTPFYIWINWVWREKDILSVQASSWRSEGKTSDTLLSWLGRRKLADSGKQTYFRSGGPCPLLFCAHKQWHSPVRLPECAQVICRPELLCRYKCFLKISLVTQKAKNVQQVKIPKQNRKLSTYYKQLILSSQLKHTPPKYIH